MHTARVHLTLRSHWTDRAERLLFHERNGKIERTRESISIETVTPSVFKRAHAADTATRSYKGSALSRVYPQICVLPWARSVQFFHPIASRHRVQRSPLHSSLTSTTRALMPADDTPTRCYKGSALSRVCPQICILPCARSVQSFCLRCQCGSLLLPLGQSESLPLALDVTTLLVNDRFQAMCARGRGALSLYSPSSAALST